jgi:transcriptional regulator with XRE-family HTH domain
MNYCIEMNVGWISRIERGQANPGLVIIIKLAQALECQPGDLLDDL